MALGPGSRLGPYEIIALLGAGGMGEVYRARDTRLDRDVAIKILAPYLSSNADALTRFEREAKAVAALSHPAIVAIHDFASHEGTAYAVTELLDGQTLRDRLAAGSLPVRTALDYSVQVAEGLAAAHDKGLVHRDLKPENLFVTTEGRAKILDFGLVRRASADIDSGAVTVSSPTTPGTVLGTAGYMSPEQASGRPVDFRSDQFSLGSILYEMLSGTRAFARPTSPETLSAIIRDEPTPIAALNPSVPVPLRWILERCLAKNPAARYVSTQDLARELRTLLEHLPEATPSADLPSASRTRAATGRTAQRLTTSKAALGAVAAGLLLLVGAGVYLLTSRREPATIDSLAVLPLTSDDPQTEYLSDGITEVLINSLSRLPTLKVLARTTVFRYKGTDDPIKTGRELGVRALLTGKVVQRADTLIVQVELVDVASGGTLWGDQYNRKLADVVAVQEEIARRISETLRPRLTGDQQQRVARPSTQDADAYQLYLRGRFHLNKITEQDLGTSIEYFNQALARDPGFALAYVGLSDAYGMLGQTYRRPRETAAKTKASFEKALELDEKLPEAHMARGAYSLFFAWDWAVAESELRRAIELNPNFALAHDLYGQFLSAMGRFDEAIAENKLAVDVDPLSALSGANLAVTYYFARQHDRVIGQSRKTLALDPEYFFASLYIGWAYAQRREYEQAVTELLKTRNLPGGLAPATSALGYVYAISARRRDAQQMLRELEGLASREYVDPFYVAMVHLGLNDLDQTFAWLDKAYEERSFWLLWLNVEPKFDRIRPDPRFAALQRRLKFPKQQASLTAARLARDLCAATYAPRDEDVLRIRHAAIPDPRLRSTYAFSMGLPGRMKRSSTPWR